MKLQDAEQIVNPDIERNLWCLLEWAEVCINLIGM
jgi:hypothetical protein